MTMAAQGASERRKCGECRHERKKIHGSAHSALDATALGQYRDLCSRGTTSRKCSRDRPEMRGW